MILFGYRILTLFSHLSRKVISRHKEQNEKVWADEAGRFLERLPDKKEYIEHQKRMKTLTLGKWFGREFPASYNSCEVIAVYNAMVSEGMPSPDFPFLLAAFEKKGLALNGFFGASPVTVQKFLKKSGYETLRINGEKKIQACLPQMEKDYRTWIVTLQNNRDNLKEEIHTMCITKHGADFILHNDYSGGSGYSRYHSLGEVLLAYNEGKAKPISLIAVKLSSGRAG